MYTIEMLKLRHTIILLIAELWFFTLKVECDGNFTLCFNTATETHCFSKIVSGPVNFTDAQNRCGAIDATIPVIKDGEVQQLLETFISNLGQSGGKESSIRDFWLNAYPVFGTQWQWLDSSIIIELNANILNGQVFFNVHVASLARQNSSQQDVHLVANEAGEIFSYICEFFGSDCQRQDGSVLQYGDKCYVAYKDNGTWYEARNRCLQERGDLASFGDLKSTNINFTQWLDLSNAKQYWVGARILWWSWKTSGNPEVRYTSWNGHYPSLLTSTDACVTVSGSSVITGWTPGDCNQVRNVGVICQKVTSIASSKSTTVASFASSKASTIVVPFDSSKDTTFSNCSGCTSTMNSLESSAVPVVSIAIPLGVGIGVGLGIIVIIVIIVIITVCVRKKRSETLLEQNIRNGITELGAVQAQSAEQVNNFGHPINYVYPPLDRNLSNNSYEEIHDELGAASETQYEELDHHVTNDAYQPLDRNLGNTSFAEAMHHGAASETQYEEPLDYHSTNDVHELRDRNLGNTSSEAKHHGAESETHYEEPLDYSTNDDYELPDRNLGDTSPEAMYHGAALETQYEEPLPN